MGNNLKQSQVQLDLLTPDGENKDLFYRRLREGIKKIGLMN